MHLVSCECFSSLLSVSFIHGDVPVHKINVLFLLQEIKVLKESVSKPYHDQLSQLNISLETKDRELAEINKISAEQKHGIEDLNERLSASMQSCIEANEIINR